MAPEYTFRLADAADLDGIVCFMRAHWQGPHPLIEQPDFFEYYYRRPDGGLNFALCEQGGAMAALAGYIPANLAPQPDIWVSLWVANPACKGSGLELMAALPRLTGCHTLACNNIRPKTRAFYEFLGYTTGQMAHAYRLANKPAYQVAKVLQKHILSVGGDAVLAPAPTAEALEASGFVPPQNANPYRDWWYICRRFYGYPHQSYQVYTATLPGQAAPAALLAVRPVPVLGTTVLRIACYVGPADIIPQLGGAIQGLMEQCGAEYADWYCAGVDEALLNAAGFTVRGEQDPNILPNYLTPPLCENTDYYYFTTRPEGFTMFKADGDQDRPNLSP